MKARCLRRSLTPEARLANEKKWYRDNNYVRFNVPMPRLLASALRAAALNSGMALHKFTAKLLAEVLMKEAKAPEQVTSAEELLG